MRRYSPVEAVFPYTCTLIHAVRILPTFAAGDGQYDSVPIHCIRDSDVSHRKDSTDVSGYKAFLPAVTRRIDCPEIDLWSWVVLISGIVAFMGR